MCDSPLVRAARRDESRCGVLASTDYASFKMSVSSLTALSRALTADFLTAFTAWAADQRYPVFLFEAFDEAWKGGDHPAEVEKHWGVYRADRTPKQALAGAAAD